MNMDAVDFHAPYFTARSDALQEDSVPFGLLTDLLGVLEGVAGSDLFFHRPDNHVEYRALADVGGVKRYIEIDPGRFRVGDIVKIQLSFVCIPVAGGHFKMMPIMHALTQLDTRFCQVWLLLFRETIHLLKHRHQAAMEARIKAVRQLNVKQYTSMKTLKRKMAYSKEDEDVENARALLVDLNICDVTMG
ncbi:hypothetical protein DXG01_009697 [Tephrocybe rancida]|nr:hypothetical protein DXG01_009697 [Tephrocybe rancida]